MKKARIATIIAVLLTFSAAGITKAADIKQPLEAKKLSRLTGPHTATLGDWTNIIRSLRKAEERPKTMPDKPFRFRLKQNQNNLVEL